jgi:opacity protein-like surface antigen
MATDSFATQTFDQYVSLKGTASRIGNTLSGSVDVLGVKVDGLTDRDHGTVGGANIAYGVDFSKSNIWLRTELEVGISGKSGYSKKITVEGGCQDRVGVKYEKQSFLLNFSYDFHNKTPVTPYLGFGIGAARIKATAGYSYTNTRKRTYGLMQRKSKVNFAWQVGAGVSYAITDSLSADLGYRYVDYGQIKHNAVYYSIVNVDVKVQTREHQFYAGIRYTFK